MADDGREETYQYADMIFRQLGIPTYWGGGNHDNVRTMQKFCDSAYCAYTVCAHVQGVNILFADTVTPDDDNPAENRARGLLSQSQLDELEKYMEDESTPCVVVMHHPSFKLDSWITDKILINRDEFNELIHRHASVKAVLSGHIHCFNSFYDGGVLFTSASSTAFAFNGSLAKGAIDYGAEGFSVLDIDKDGVTINNCLI